MRLWGTTTGLVLAVAVTVVHADERKFYGDDPVRYDDDRLDTPRGPAPIELSDLYDRLRHTFGQPGSPEWGEAENVNTLDQVPDSTWFTNRHGAHRMTLDELTRGPNRDGGPDPRTIWTIVGGKVGGLTPGFEIVDAQGVRYVIKLDPAGLPELSSAAEVIATKLFYAVGYNVPENYIVDVHPETLAIDPEASLQDEFGQTRRLTDHRLRRMLARMPRLDDGRIRVTASKYLEGEPIGPFRYHGTRSDDPNDIVPHENRRELRGLRLFAAWLNHDDVRAQNTLDTWVENGDRHYVTHHLIDFGSTFGSGTVDLQVPNLGFHYWLDMDLVRRNARGFGFHTPKYRTVTWPNFPAYASVGRFEADAFEPEEWKPDYPNPAFVRMTDRDAFWAAAIIASFTPMELRAIVGTGEFSDPAQQAYFYETLRTRQQKTAKYYVNRINPIDAFRVDRDRLTFANLSERYGFATPRTRYRTRWMVYNNAADSYLTFTAATLSTASAVALPAIRLRGSEQYLVAEISSEHPDHPRWNAPVLVYLRPVSDGVAVVGIERPSTADAGPHTVTALD